MVPVSDALVVEDRGEVRWIAVDRYERRNAWTIEMGRQLGEILEATRHEDGVRVVVLTGRGGCFSAGIDREVLADPPASTPFGVEEFLRFDKPTIACVDGLAFGMGTTIALGCDLRVASTRATLTLGFSALGLTPEWGASFLLWRQVGWSRALDLSLTNRTVAADEALAIGLVDRVVAVDEVEGATQALAEQIASLPGDVAAATKAVLWQGLEQATLAGARSVELESIVERRAGARHGGST